MGLNSGPLTREPNRVANRKVVPVQIRKDAGLAVGTSPGRWETNHVPPERG